MKTNVPFLLPTTISAQLVAVEIAGHDLRADAGIRCRSGAE